MTCISPPELEDAQLLRFIDGQAGAAVKSHLDRCAACRRRAEELATLQKHLGARLDRLTCPSSVELGEYHLGLLPADGAEAVRRHLAECVRCSGELAQLGDYLKQVGPDLDVSFGEQVKVLVARLADSLGGLGLSGAPAWQPALAGVRGDVSGPRLYQAEDLQVSVEAQADPQVAGRRQLLGLLLGAEGGPWQAQLQHDAGPAATQPIDELGNFIFSDLVPGNYELVLTGPGVELHVTTLDV